MADGGGGEAGPGGGPQTRRGSAGPRSSTAKPGRGCCQKVWPPHRCPPPHRWPTGRYRRARLPAPARRAQGRGHGITGESTNGPREAGIDLSTIAGSGPGGTYSARRSGRRASPLGGEPVGCRGRRRPASGQCNPGWPAAKRFPSRGNQPPETSEIKVIGLRRLIAERMSEGQAQTFRTFAYVEGKSM